MQKPFKTILDNGLRVILLENHSAPVASFKLWCSVGSSSEKENEAGLCHLIEHMLFKGTHQRGVGQIASEVEAAGGDINAYTSFDETVYYINIPSEESVLALDILADAVMHSTFDEEELRREKEVVVEEISRSDDNPGQVTSQNLFSTAFRKHPYGNPIAGSRETVRDVSRDTLIGFFKKWYVAKNMILVGVGDFDSREILKQTREIFSKVSAKPVPERKREPEPEQTKLRTVTKGMPVEGRYLDLAFPVPDILHEDIPALDVLSHILGGSSSSRFERVLKEQKQLVTSISCYPYTIQDPCLLMIGATLQGNTVVETLKEIWKQIDLIEKTPPSSVELARTRENIRSVQVYEKQTMDALARKLAFSEGLTGRLDFDEDYYRAVNALTPEDIRRVAQKYLLPSRMTVSLGHPKSEKWTSLKLHQVSAKASRPLREQKTSVSRKEMQEFRLSNGIRILVRENETLPLISIRSASLGGVHQERESLNGISHFMASLLTKGTKHRTEREISEQCSGLSGNIDGYAGRDLIGVSGTFLSEKISEGLDLFFDILLNPLFEKKAIEKEKQLLYTILKSQEDSLAQQVIRKFLKALYGKHPYGRPPLGSRKTISRIRSEDLREYHQKIFQPSNMTLAVSGDVDAGDLRERIEDKLAQWHSRPFRMEKLDVPEKPHKPKKEFIRKKRAQAHLVYGFLGCRLHSEDRVVFDVMSQILSGQGGRLFLELRDKQSLCYSVSASSYEGREPGYFMVYIGTEPQKLDMAFAGITYELERLRKEPVTPEELHRAQQCVIGNYIMDLQKNSTHASLMAYNVVQGIPLSEIADYPRQIRKVTEKDIQRVALKYLNPAHSVLSVLKP